MNVKIDLCTVSERESWLFPLPLPLPSRNGMEQCSEPGGEKILTRIYYTCSIYTDMYRSNQ